MSKHAADILGRRYKSLRRLALCDRQDKYLLFEDCSTMADLLRCGGVSIPTETRCGQDAGFAATQATKAFTHSLLFPTLSPIILEADRGAALAADSSMRPQELASWRGQRCDFFFFFAF